MFRRKPPPEPFVLAPRHDPAEHLPEWFLRLSPLSMDALKGPDEQYCAGAEDMLIVVRQMLGDG